LTSQAPEAANAGKGGAQHKAIAVAHDKRFLTVFRRSILFAPADYLFITQYRRGREGESEKIAGDAIPEVGAEGCVSLFKPSLKCLAVPWTHGSRQCSGFYFHKLGFSRRPGLLRLLCGVRGVIVDLDELD
jgi:hypothetical protein